MTTPTYTLYPVLPLRGTVVFPGMTLPLRVGRPQSMAALKAAKERPWALVLTQKTDAGGDSEPSADDMYRVGTLVKIEKVRGNEKSGYQVLARGVARFRVRNLRKNGAYLEAEGEALADNRDVDAKTNEALLESLKTAAKEILKLVPADTDQFVELLDGINDLELLTHLSAGNIDIPLEQKQEILETVSTKNRVLKLLDLMMALKENLEVQGQIRDKLTHKLGKNQRENILREQLRQIQEELGEGGEEGGSDDFRKKIADAGMPEEAKKVALEELKRLEAIGKASPESHVIRNYLDLLCAMPWSKSSGGDIDLDAARKILDEDHYGLDKIKKRILQHLAVMKLKKEGRGTILLFVGPPGVGKTSLGQSIARALGRKFARASLGGVRDDAEIRGHRRTYIGAMPGRIIQSIKRAGENNPVLMLDEIDKLGASFQGDPAAALLEVLDPEQNANFMDHYLDVPFDLSKVVFVATANSLDTIPGPLRDRMEIIELTGYTTAEKLHIAKRHLVPKQLKEHGIEESQLTISDEALLRLIAHYTREAGVRELQRKIAEVARANTEKVIAGTSGRVEAKDLEEILGPERFVHEVVEGISPPGVVTGLAWTPVGGDILFIEAELMPGNGKLTITGQLGEVMKESAQIALSLVRSRMASVVPNFDFAKNDLHLHVPAGAIPKDGPSAGVTMLTALASLFSGRRVASTLAMTGEITLRGAVLPVGGIKEKVIAAHRAGIKKVLLPKRNEKDLRDVPEEVRSQLQFEFMETAGDVLKAALGLSFEPAPRAFADDNPQAPASAASA
ncbi:MAG: endopeptidase La [Bdellovibrionota bacterium]